MRIRSNVVRHIVSHTIRNHARGGKERHESERPELIEDDKIMPGTAWRDAVCIALAIVVLVGFALLIESEFHLDGDVIYDAGAAIGSHPLSRAFRRCLDCVV